MADKDNLVAASASPYFAMATDQLVDLEIQTFRSAVTGLRLQDVRFLDKGATLLCDISTGQPCPMAPAGWHRCVFDSIHALSYPGVRASVKLVGVKFVWLGLMKDVREWVAACVACQCAKVHMKAFRPH